MARVLDGGNLSETVQVTNGVKLGCVLTPTLFSTMFSAMLLDAFQDKQDGINIKYRTDLKLFNIRRLQASTKVKETAVRDFLFRRLCSQCDIHNMQLEMDSCASACNSYGLAISTKKTERGYVPTCSWKATYPAQNLRKWTRPKLC